MRLFSVGKVLATRCYQLEEGNTVRTVTALIGMPKRIPNSSDFYCPYQVQGVLDGQVRYAEGVDEAQALYLAMEGLGALLSSLPEMRAGRLTWFGEPSHGFPVRAERPQLRLVASS